MKEHYLIILDRPEDVGVKEMKKYIKEAVGHWNGQYHPDEPLFSLSNKITVKRLPWKDDAEGI